MATVAQQSLPFPARSQDGHAIAGRPRDVLAILQHSTLPAVPHAGLILLFGHAAVYRLGLCAAADQALAGGTVLYLAGANAFDPFLIGRLARASRLTPSHALERILVSRAFTCHQIVRLVADRLAPAIWRYGARRVILSGPLETLYDESVSDQEAVRLFHTMLAALQRLIQQDIQILCVSPLPAMASGVRRGFLPALRAHACRAIDVRATDEGIWLHAQEAADSTSWMIPHAVWSRL